MANHGQPTLQPQDHIVDMSLYTAVLEAHQDKLRDFRTIIQVEGYVCTEVNYLQGLPKQV